MSTVRVTPDKLAVTLRANARRERAIVASAALAAAHRYRAHLVELVDGAGVTDTGVYRRSFKVIRSADGLGATVENHAPHAGVLERGARPHFVGAKVRAMIARWARRKLGLSQKEAIAAAWAIAYKISREGSKAHYFVRDSLPVARRLFGDEVRRRLKRGVARSVRAGGDV